MHTTHATTLTPITLVLCALLVVFASAAPARADEAARTGTIRAELQLRDGQRIAQAFAVERRAQTMVTRRGDELDIGLEAVDHRGTVAIADDAVTVTFSDLPVPGRYDLRIEMRDGGIVHGWDARVPESDYVGDPDIEPDQVRELLERQADDEFTAFFDHVLVLAVAGNVQHATLLVAQLRQRPFVGGGYRDGEWIWRVDRWQWEDPWEHHWTPYQERPFYALVRERVFEAGFNALRWRFAAHLGGLTLTVDEPTLDLGNVSLPATGRGVRAVDREGDVIEPNTLKGGDVFAP